MIFPSFVLLSPLPLRGKNIIRRDGNEVDTMTEERADFLQTCVIAAVVLEVLNRFSGKTATGLLVDIENVVSAGFP